MTPWREVLSPLRDVLYVTGCALAGAAAGLAGVLIFRALT
jgi:hypothetical protein